MKHELEKVTGAMIEETKRVQQNVWNAMREEVKPRRRIRWQYPVIATLFIVLVATLLYTQIVPSQNTTAQVEPLNEGLFELFVYSNQYEQGKFMTIEDAKNINFEQFIERSALISYANYKGINITEDEIEETTREIEAAFSRNELSKIKLAHMLQTLNMTEAQHKELLMISATANVAKQKLLATYKTMDGRAYGQLLNDARSYYERMAENTISKFKVAHHMTQTSTNVLQPVGLPETLSFLNNFQVGMNEVGEYEFIQPDDVQNYIQDEYSDVLYEAAPYKKYPFEFGPIFYMETKHGLQQLAANSDSIWQHRAQQLLEILNVLENSFRDDYPFLHE